MQNLRIVPWASKAEWLQVYHGLFSDRTSPEFIQSIDRVNIWRKRGRVPVSVEATVSLLEALRLYETQKISFHDSQMLFGMAITRFINGIVDKEQKGAYALPIAQIAADLDIPRVLVDIRHAATHDELPALPLLRKASLLAFKWLDENYWQVQLKFVDEMQIDLSTLIKRYKDDRKSDIKAAVSTYSQESPLKLDEIPLSENLMSLCMEINNLCTDEYYKDILIPILLSDGCLVPLNKRKRPSLELGLPDDLLALWVPLLFNFANNSSTFYIDLFQSILLKLVDSIYRPSKSSSFAEALCTWGYWLLSEIGQPDVPEATVEALYIMIIKNPGLGHEYLSSNPIFKKTLKKHGQIDIYAKRLSCLNSSKTFATYRSSLNDDELLEIESEIEEMKSWIISNNNTRSMKSSLSTNETIPNGPWMEPTYLIEWDKCPLGSQLK